MQFDINSPAGFEHMLIDENEKGSRQFISQIDICKNDVFQVKARHIEATSK